MIYEKNELLHKFKRFSLIFINFHTSVLLHFSIISGVAKPFICGFSVDSNEKLYIGTQNGIDVYSDGELVDTIKKGTKRSYYFTIMDDKILVATTSMVYILETDGKIVQKTEDESDIYERLSCLKFKEVTSRNGNVYSIESPFGWTQVVKNGAETVYHLTPISYTVKLLIFALPGCLFLFVLGILEKLKAKGS